MSLWLHALGAEVYGYALQPETNPSLYQLADVDDKVASTIADIRDYKVLQQALNQCQPDIVIHMAAQPLVRYSYEHPQETFEVNVMGTINVLEAVRYCKSVKVVVNVTTDKCYDNKEWCWGYRENEPMGGKDPYSSSKACSELATASYRHSYFNPDDYQIHGKSIASARAGNVIGGGDWAQDRLIPDIISAFLRQEKVQIRNAQATRPWQHVLEPLSGYLLLAEKMWSDPVHLASAWNFGPMNSGVQPVGYIVDFIAKHWGDEAAWSSDSGKLHPHEANCLKLDISKAQTLLGWQPRWSLDQTLISLIDWYKGWHQQQNVQQLVYRQIESYQQAVLSSAKTPTID